MDAQNKELNPDEVSRFSETEGIAMYETSAKTGKNVTGVFTEICRKLISQRDQQKRQSFKNKPGKSLFDSSAPPRQEDDDNQVSLGQRLA